MNLAMRRRDFISIVPAPLLSSPVKAEHILWCGSSNVCFHNLPKLVAAWATDYGAKNVASEIVGKGGTGIHQFLRPGFQAEYGLRPGQTFVEKLAAGGNRFVVLQAVARFLADPPEPEYAAAFPLCCDAIRKAGGEPVLYETGWEADIQAGRDRVMNIAREQKIRIFAPCSTVWSRVRSERPDLELHSPPDMNHPGALGHYLNACCLFTALTRKHPQPLPLEYPVWYPVDDRDSAEGDRLVAAHKSADPYYDALPLFLKRRTMLARPYRLDVRTADYFKETIWEVWLESQRKLGLV